MPRQPLCALIKAIKIH